MVAAAALKAEEPVASADSPAGALKQLSIEELMTINVTSVSKQPEELLDAASAIQVVTSDDIERSTASSIPEALQLAGNLDIAQKNSHDWEISARGFNANLGDKLLVLMDGRTVYTPLYSGVLWDVQNYLMEDIDRIEVISGPGGSLWGANAVNGVINITSKSAQETQGLYVDAGGGTPLEGFASARYGGTLAPGLYYRVYGTFFDRGDEELADGSSAQDSWRMRQGGFRIDSVASASNKLTLQGDTYSGSENQGAAGTSQENGSNVLGRWTHIASDDVSTSLQVYYDRTFLSYPFLTPLNDDLQTYDIDFQQNARLGQYQNVVWGLGYRFTREADTGSTEVLFIPPVLDQNLYSGFAQDEIELQPHLFLILGTKLEHNDYTGYEVEPNVRLRWNLSSTQMLWAAVSRAVRTPSRYDRDLEIPTYLPAPLPASILNGGGSAFASETLIAYELGYRAQLGAKASTSVSTFCNSYDHLEGTVAAPIAPPHYGLPVVFTNDMEGDTYGAELSLSYKVADWWLLHGSYDYLQEDLRTRPGYVDATNDANDTADPEHQFSLRSSMDLLTNLEFDSTLRWVDSLRIDNGPNGGPVVGTVPAYCELDVRLGWHATKNLTISLNGQNLLHDRHAEYGYPGAAQEQIVRGVYAKIAWQY